MQEQKIQENKINEQEVTWVTIAEIEEAARNNDYSDTSKWPTLEMIIQDLEELDD